VRRWSIRSRITLAATALAAVVLVVLAMLVVLVQQAQLRANLDNSLEQRAALVSAQFVDDGGAGTSNAEDRFVQVLDADGVVIASSENLAGRAGVVDLPAGELAVETRDDVPIEDDTYRVLIRAFDDRSFFVIVGENVDDVADALRGLVVALAVLIPAALIALAATIWWLVGRTLRPVDEIRREVVEVGLDELDRRVPVPEADDEVARLATTMNEMLSRLETASRRQRQFVADVSHELRSPLTRLRTQLEVDLATGDVDLETTCRSVLGDTIEMQGLVDDLLFLARHDAGATTPSTVPVDLDAVVEAEVRHQREAHPGVTIDMAGVSGAMVRGDGKQYGRVVSNLLSNAVRHAEGRVVVSVGEVDGEVVLEVADDGSGIAPEDRERVFERFVRLDEARTGGGAGLGLAIARDVIAAHGGTVEVGDSRLGGARVVVRIPVG
jgi:signal transduction histidine kinase